jgi:hypothetical protein
MSIQRLRTLYRRQLAFHREILLNVNSVFAVREDQVHRGEKKYTRGANSQKSLSPYAKFQLSRFLGL